VPRIDETACKLGSRSATSRERELSTPTLDERLLAGQHTTGKPDDGRLFETLLFS